MGITNMRVYAVLGVRRRQRAVQDANDTCLGSAGFSLLVGYVNGVAYTILPKDKDKTQNMLAPLSPRSCLQYLHWRDGQPHQRY